MKDYGELVIIGKTFGSPILLGHDDILIPLYECKRCGARQIRYADGCHACKKKVEVAAHHEEEAAAGIL